MAIESRYVFPGYVPASIRDTATMEIEIGTIKGRDTEYTVHVLRPREPEGLPFLVGTIKVGSTVIWDFKRENTTDYGRLAWADDELVIAFLGRGRDGTLRRVIPVDAIGKRPFAMQKLMQLKIAAAEFLNREVEWTKEERRVRQILAERARVEVEQAEKAERAKREAAKQERITRLLSRERVVAYTPDGKQRHGLPMVGDEWMSLPHGTFVVLVESYTEETTGAPIEAFMVKKERGGNPRKDSVAPVMAEKPAVMVEKKTVTPVRTVMVENEEGIFEVALYRSMDEIRQARAAGLNSGTYVAVETGKSTITVFSVFKDRIDTVGNCQIL